MSQALLPCGVLFLTLWVTMLPLPPGKVTPEWGFGYYSMNLLSPFLGGSLIDVPFRVAPGQYEGYNYLGLGVLLALLFPGQPMHLKASAWLPLHWVLGLASYGLFAAAVVHAVLMTRTEKLIRQAVDVEGSLPLLTLERLTFRFVKAGFVLLSATLLAGWWFSDHLYGAETGWRWDHKTVFAFLAWLTFAGLLLARNRLGWRGRKATRVLYAGAGLLLLSYAGSRFVLEVILGRAA